MKTFTLLLLSLCIFKQIQITHSQKNYPSISVNKSNFVFCVPENASVILSYFDTLSGNIFSSSPVITEQSLQNILKDILYDSNGQKIQLSNLKIQLSAQQAQIASLEFQVTSQRANQYTQDTRITELLEKYINLESQLNKTAQYTNDILIAEIFRAKSTELELFEEDSVIIASLSFEIVSRTSNISADLSSTLTSMIANNAIIDKSINVSIISEASLRTVSDSTLSTSFYSEASMSAVSILKLIDSIAIVNVDLATEISTRKNNVSTLTSQLMLDISSRVLTDASLSSSYMLADNSLSARLYTEVSLRNYTDTTFAIDLNVEISSRLIEDLFLSASINTDISMNGWLDSQLSISLATETSRAINKEILLGNITDHTLVSIKNLSVLNSYVNGLIGASIFCGAAPLEILQYGNHSHCTGVANGFACTPNCYNGYVARGFLTCIAGTWGGVSECLPKPCNFFPLIPSQGEVSTCINQPNGTLCNPVCNLGYYNTSSALCVLGNWTGSATCSLYPPSMVIGLSVWVHAGAGIVQSNGLISQWMDQSGNGNNFQMSIASQQPTLVMSGISGLPSLQMVAANKQQMIMSTNFASPTWSMYTVAKMNGNVRERIVGGLNNNWLFGWWGGKENVFYFDNWLISNGPPASLNAFIYSAVSSSAGVSIYKNSVLLGTSTINGGPNGLILTGYSTNPSEFSDCLVSEIAFFTATLSTAQRISMDLYFKLKYALY